MIKVTLIAGVLISLTFLTKAQPSTDEKVIAETIARLFKGMEKGDSAMVSTAFANEVTMATAFRDKNNNPGLRREYSIKEFLQAVGKPHPDIWYEEIWNLKIQIDGDFAQAWCDYGFYLGKNFSHCGVDAFQLHNGKDGWKIFHLADTQRKTGCTIPQEIQDKHN